MTISVNTALCSVIMRLIHAAVIWFKNKVKPLPTTVTLFSSRPMDTDISALHPPTLLVTVVCHIVQVAPDVAIRGGTFPCSYPFRYKNEETDQQDPQGHFTQKEVTAINF